MLLAFFAYVLLLSWGNETLYSDNARLLLLSVVTGYLAYYGFMLNKEATLVKVSIVLAAMICFTDLVYTYAFVGNFPVQRVYHLFFPNNLELEELNDTNHNFYGFICGIGFVSLLSDYINHTSPWKKVTLILLPVMIMGVLMSTSRSTLLGLMIAVVFIMYRGLKNPLSRKRSAGVLTVAGVITGVMLFLFIALQSFFELDSAFIDNISFRLVEEPVAVIRKNLGYSYNVQNLDAMDWRKESASLALEAYGRLPLKDQILGVGIGGYLQRNLGHNGLNPHNGILYILVESGLVGFMLYFTMLWQLLKTAFKRKPLSPLVLVIIFIIFYSLGQNEELISATAILFVSTLIIENRQEAAVVIRRFKPTGKKELSIV
jgi:O-antigen ligase